MANRNLTLIRLQKEVQKLEKNPIKNCLIKRKNILQFHFCFYGLDGDYEKGYYHGVLELATNYPFAPPVLKFFTPSGRFETNKPICTTFTNYHKESWSTAWNVQTMILATISFFQANENTAGAVVTSAGQKQKLAKESMAWNLQNEEFINLFPLEQFDNYPEIVALSERIKKGQKISRESKIVNETGKSGLLMVILAILFVLYIIYKVTNQNQKEPLQKIGKGHKQHMHPPQSPPKPE